MALYFKFQVQHVYRQAVDFCILALYPAILCNHSVDYLLVYILSLIHLVNLHL